MMDSAIVLDNINIGNDSNDSIAAVAAAAAGMSNNNNVINHQNNFISSSPTTASMFADIDRNHFNNNNNNSSSSISSSSANNNGMKSSNLNDIDSFNFFDNLSTNTSSVFSNGSIIIPDFLAVAASEHEQQQRQQLHQQQESQRQHMKEQLEFFQMMRQQQQALQNQHENQSVTSQSIQQLLEENNSLISTFYEQIRKTRPLSQTSNWSLLLDQIRQNLKTISHLMANNGKEKTSSSNSQSYEDMQQAVFSSQSLLSMQMQQNQDFSPNLKPAENSNQQQTNGSTLHNLGPHLKTNPHSTAAVIAAAATLVYSRYNSGIGSLSSSVIPSIHVTPSTSPSWKLFESVNDDINFPYPIDPSPIVPVSTNFAEANKSTSKGKRLPKPIPKSALISNAASSSSASSNIFSPSHENSHDIITPTGGSDMQNSNKKRSKEQNDLRINSDIPDIFERVDSDDDFFGSDEEIKIKKKVKKPKLPNVSSPRDGENKKPRKSGPSGRDEQVPAHEIFAEMEGLPKEFVDTAKQFSKSEARHWQSIKPHVARAGKRSESLPEQDRWRAWVEITADLPLNNGGPIRRVLEVAVFCAERSCSDPNILKVLNKALGPSVYKANAAGGCRRMALEMLQTFPESSNSSKQPKKSKSPQPVQNGKESVGIETTSSSSPGSTSASISMNTPQISDHIDQHLKSFIE